MSKSGQTLTKFLWGMTQNVAANLLIVLLPIVIGGLYALYSASAETVLLWLLIVLVALNILITFGVLRRQRVAERPLPGILVRDAESGILYLEDSLGRLREIPDIHTSSYLVEALGALQDVSDVSKDEIARRRGGQLPTIKQWEAPLTSEEQALKDLRSRVSRGLRVAAHFDDTSTPQGIIVQVSNSNDGAVYFKEVSFQHNQLHSSALTSSHVSAGIRSQVRLEQNAVALLSGCCINLSLQLAQIWKRRDIECMKGQWGWLHFDILYEGQQIDDLLYPI